MQRPLITALLVKTHRPLQGPRCSAAWLLRPWLLTAACAVDPCSHFTDEEVEATEGFHCLAKGPWPVCGRAWMASLPGWRGTHCRLCLGTCPDMPVALMLSHALTTQPGRRQLLLRHMSCCHTTAHLGPLLGRPSPHSNAPSSLIPQKGPGAPLSQDDHQSYGYDLSALKAQEQFRKLSPYLLNAIKSTSLTSFMYYSLAVPKRSSMTDWALWPRGLSHCLGHSPGSILAAQPASR